MESLVELAHRAALAEPRAALTVAELVRMLRREGRAVSAGSLVRALEAEPARFRVLDPWRGVLRAFRPDPEPTHELLDRLVVLAPDARSDDRGPGWRVRSALATLAHGLEERSETHRTRWLGLLLQARRSGLA